MTIPQGAGADMAYPASLELDAGTTIARWRPLVHWILAIPHAVISQILNDLGGVVAVISWFAIVFTGRVPEGLANFQCLVIRYAARTYSYALWMREPYPAFEFSVTPEDPGGDPVRVELRPAIEDRDRLTVGLRFLWIIPAALFGLLVAIGAVVVAFVSFWAVVFTGSYPQGLRDFMVGSGRFFVRLTAYGSLLTDEYPPFSLR